MASSRWSIPDSRIRSTAVHTPEAPKLFVKQLMIRDIAGKLLGRGVIRERSEGFAGLALVRFELEGDGELAGGVDDAEGPPAFQHFHEELAAELAPPAFQQLGAVTIRAAVQVPADQVLE